MNEQAIQLLVQIWNELTGIPQEEQLTETTQLVIEEIEAFLEDQGLVRNSQLTSEGERILY